jgi:hypothetical protein
VSALLARPLQRLLFLRVRGAWRKQLRRLRTPAGLFMALLGTAIFAIWMASVLVGGSARGLPPETVELRLGLVALSFSAVTLAGALRFRGLFLPREEIERLFAAPLARADLVRYRLCMSILRSLIGGGIVALGAARMFRPAFAFPATLVALASLTVLHQLAAIGFGRFELGLGRWLNGASRMLTLLGLGALAVLLGALLSGAELRDLSPVGPGLVEPFDSGGLLARVTWIFRPWTRPIAATNAAEFLPWFALDLVLLGLLFEATARLPVDFRELSLDTSASIAARLRRWRQMGGAASSEASAVHARAVPWIFGRGPFGAIAWRKTSSILRKARSVLGVTLVVIAAVLLVSRPLAGAGDGAFGPVLVSVIGVIYLCSGLRFDFREDLERMEAIKAWPLSPRAIFVGMLLPEAVLVSVLVMAVVGAEAALGGWQEASIACLALLPPTVFGWIALDNAVFLFAPVRATPGQEGMLQNAGRTALLMLARLALLAVAAGAGLAAFWLAGLAAGVLGATRSVALSVSLGATWLAVVLEDAALVYLGGLCLRRFDVARDRG